MTQTEIRRSEAVPTEAPTGACEAPSPTGRWLTFVIGAVAAIAVAVLLVGVFDDGTAPGGAFSDGSWEQVEHINMTRLAPPADDSSQRAEFNRHLGLAPVTDTSYHEAEQRRFESLRP